MSQIFDSVSDDQNQRERRNECCTLIFLLLLFLFYYIVIIFLLLLELFILGYIYIYLFTCVFIHCVCRVSVECKVHYGNKKITPV